MAAQRPEPSLAAQRVEMRRLRDGIFEHLYSGRYFLRRGGSNAGEYFLCDGRALVCIELCEGRVYRPVRFESEDEAIDHILSAMSDIRTRVLSSTPYTACQDEDVPNTLANLRQVQAELQRWTFWRWFDGLHFDHVWPRRLRRPHDA